MSFKPFIVFLGLACLNFFHLQATTLLPSTESDPDAFVEKCVNVINGDYCETARDLEIIGPDPLVFQRHFNAKNYMTGKGFGGWRIFPQTLLVVGKDPQNKECSIGQERFEWVYAYTGERSGGILTYSGWKKSGGDTKEPLKIDALQDAIGMVNTYAEEISGQTNHLNNSMHIKRDTCELTLGDDTKRLYQKVKGAPAEILGEELSPTLASKVLQPHYFQLLSETLPSGNVTLFSYDEKGHLTSIEMRDSSQEKLHSWIRLAYAFSPQRCSITLTTSDEKTLTYAFERLQAGKDAHLVLKEVKGSYGIPCSYDYIVRKKQCFLIRKNLPEGRFLEIEYDNTGRVKTLKGPSGASGKSELIHQFAYGDKWTDVTNAGNIKTRYHYDDRLQLIAIERYDQKGKLYRADKKYYGKSKQDVTLLLARTVADGAGKVLSYRCFKYDNRGNVLEERLYGNLTGKKEASLQVDANGQLLKPDQEECHLKTFGYSEDGFNLLTRLGDCKGNKTTYTYEKNSNRLSKKLIQEKNSIKKREFHFYNSDAVCTKIIEDDGSDENVDQVYGMNERHIKEFHPKERLPGLGLSEVIQEKGFDCKSKKEILAKKLVNTYAPQGHLTSCATHDSNGTYAYTVSKTYNNLGQVTSEKDPVGRVTSYSYDGIGNQVLIAAPHLNKIVEKKYDFKGNLIQTIEKAGNLQAATQSTYDILGRKITSTDQFGQTTQFEYDAFGYLTKIIHPTVLDEYEKPTQLTFSYTYDIFGNALSVTDPKGYTTRKAYNLRGTPTKIDYPDGSVELFKYDPEGSLHRSLTRDQILTVYEYDYLGRVSYEELSTINEKGVESYIGGRRYEYHGFALLNHLSINNLYTEFCYDPLGRVITTIQHDSQNSCQSRKIEILYDPLGRESKKKIWHDEGSLDYSTECFEYDLLGNIIEKRVEDAAGLILLRTCFIYDDAGRCTEEYVFSKGQKQTLIKTTYNAFGEPISYLDAAKNETKTIIDYGKNSLTKTLINPLGVQTILDFDALGRVKSITKKDAHGGFLSAQNTLYDGLGNKSLETNLIFSEGKQIGVQKNRWIYGPMGRIEECVEAEGTSEEKRTIYSYNDLGKMITKTLLGATSPLSYSYDKKGRLSEVQYKNEGEKAPTLSNTYHYNNKGNLTSASALNGNSISRSYDVFDQIIKETVKDNGGSYTLSFGYDRRGRLKTIMLPDRSTIAYSYDGVSGKEVKRLSSEGKELYKHTYATYDALGRLTEETLIGYCGNRKTQYDAANHKVFVGTGYCTETVPEKGYNAVGNLLTIQRKGSFPTENGAHTYNALSQLTSEKNGNITYSYDSIDNRLKENKENLLYNSLNQLVSQAKTEYVYDPQGNLIRKTLDGEETKFESNILSQLVEIEQPDKTFLRFSYDPFGRKLIKKTYNSKEKNRQLLSTTRSFYLGHHELGTLDEKGDIQTLRIPGISESGISLKSVAIEIKGKPYAVLHDISGNVSALVDSSTGKVVESYIYSAFGQEKIYDASQNLISSSAVGNHWRYAEKPIDEETGLIYFGCRYYDPIIGRWISKDPAGFVDGSNLYAYCHNNPLKLCDPFGLKSVHIDEEYMYGELETHCYCERHRTCKRGGDLEKTVSNNLPKVQHCESWEKHTPIPTGCTPYLPSSFRPSRIDKTEGWESPDHGIGFINGVWNNFKSVKESAVHLSKLANGYNIHFVHNATQGLTADPVEYLMGRNHIATDPVRLLHAMWNSYFEKNSATAKFLMVCHSQGATHVQNALLDYSPELRERILVVAIAPGSYIYQKTCASVVHYRNASVLRDLVPYLDQPGAKREKDTIVNLVSHPFAGFFDHGFQSLTYKPALTDEIAAFLKGGRN